MQKKRVTPWDNKTQGINPPVGGFDSTYYLNANEGNQNLKQKWNTADTRLITFTVL